MAGDVLAVLAAYTMAAGAHFGFGQVRFAGTLWPVYPILSLAVAGFTVALAWQYGTYRRSALSGGHRVYPLLATVATYGVLAVIVLSYLLGGAPLVARGWLVTAWVGSILCLWLGRILWRQVALRWRRQGLFLRRILIAGANQQGIAVAEQLKNPSAHGTLVLGFLDDYQRPGTEVVPGLRVIGHPANTLEQAKAVGADEVIIIAGALAWESQRLLAEMVTRPDSHIDVHISPTFYDLVTTSAELSHVEYVPMLTLRHARLSGLDAFAKGTVDRLGAAVLLLVLVPAWGFWRLKAWARGVSMLERQPVQGLKGKSFDLVSLDRRLTTSPVLARLPALWNVLRRDLSLVGPRPIRSDELRVHEPWLANLFAMRPGITGLWRLRGRELPVDERVALDLYYVRNYTVALDIQILANTARELSRRLFGFGDELARWEAAEAVAPKAAEPDVRGPGSPDTVVAPTSQFTKTPSAWSRS